MDQPQRRTLEQVKSLSGLCDGLGRERADVLTLSGLLLNALHHFGGAIALRSGPNSLSYRELDEQSSRLAAFLRSRGVQAGSRVAIHLRNGFEYVISDLAILKLAAVKVPLNELMAPSEVEYCLAHAGAAASISHASLPEPPSWPAGIVRISVPDADAARHGCHRWDDALNSPADEFICAIAAPDDAALIAYTGGTTGLPKGVLHSQHRLAINLLSHVICGEVRSGEIMLLTTPLPHSAGYHLQACLIQGGTGVLAPKFDAHRFIELVEQHSVTWTFAVPTMLYRLLDALPGTGAALPTLKTVVYGAAPMSATRLQEALAAFGPIFIQLYGQTECPNYVTILTKANHQEPRLLGSCGRPVALTCVRIMGSDGLPADAGEAGEVEVSSPYTLVEYYKNREATEEQIKDGWLRTGDLGYLDDDGFLFLVDRAKDMIISGGMNVYCGEVEVALRKHPAVRDVAVVGRPDSDWGEAVMAFVVREDEISEADLRNVAKANLSAYKVPKSFRFIAALPLTSYGKIDKKALRTLLAEETSQPAIVASR